MKFFFILFTAIFLFSNYSFAQKDTIKNEEKIKDTTKVQYDFLNISKEKNPGRAALYSAVLPGLGQAYNGSYWKIPVIYSVLGGFIFLSDYNNKQYKIYLNAYVAETDTLASTINPFVGDKSVEVLKANKEKFRRNRDLSYIAIFVAYGLSIIESNVDAQLSDFDVSDDLSLNIYPSVIITSQGKTIPTLSFGFRF